LGAEAFTRADSVVADFMAGDFTPAEDFAAADFTPAGFAWAGHISAGFEWEDFAAVPPFISHAHIAVLTSPGPPR